MDYLLNSNTSKKPDASYRYAGGCCIKQDNNYINADD